MPGDVLVVEEGDRVSADARLLEGAVEVDMSALTGESLPRVRVGRGGRDADVPLLEARDLVFSGTACTGGEARGAGLRDRHGDRARAHRRALAAGRAEESPLERQVRRVAWLIAVVAVGSGVAFVPLGDARRRAVRSPTRSSSPIGLLVGQRAGGAAADDHAGAGGRRPRSSRAAGRWSSA